MRGWITVVFAFGSAPTGNSLSGKIRSCRLRLLFPIFKAARAKDVWAFGVVRQRKNGWGF